MRHFLPTSLCLGGFLLAGSSLYADTNWPQWRGPSLNGVAAKCDPPTKWNESENVKWKVKLPGSGTGTPVIWGNQIILQTAVATQEKAPAATGTAPTAETPPPPPPGAPEGGPGPGGERRRRGGGFGGMRNDAPTQVFQFDLISLDRSTGKVAWQKTLRKELPHEGHHGDHGYASYSPVTDGKHIVAFYGSRGLHCTTMSGEILWQKDLGKMQTRNGFGEGSSPAISGNTVVIIWDHEGEDFVAAFAVDTGKELWRQKRDEPTTWTTPLIVNQGGVEQAIVAATNRTCSYELKSGKVLWEVGGQTTNVIPTPVTADGVVYVMSGFRGAALQAIKLGGSGDLASGNAMLWQHNKNTPYVPSPLLSGNRLYFFSGNNGILSCLNVKDGKPLMDAERIEGAAGFYASPVAAAGRVYLADRNGTTFVIKDADKLEVLSTNKLDEKFDASPAIVGNEIYLRGHSHLYCISAEK